MKFLLTLTLINFTPFLLKSALANADTNPFKCEWAHKNGESGWQCNNGGFYSDEQQMYDAYGSGSYTSFKKEEPDSVKDSTGWPIDLKTLKQGILEKINQKREEHQVPVLKEDENLRKNAQNTANKLIDSGDINDSSIPKENGESRACLDKSQINSVVKNWYEEGNKYKYESPDDNNENETGDFSQMVWRSSQSLGCGIANKDSKYCIVCKYYPPGNVRGQYSSNVKKDYGTVNFSF